MNVHFTNILELSLCRMHGLLEESNQIQKSMRFTLSLIIPYTWWDQQIMRRVSCSRSLLSMNITVASIPLQGRWILQYSNKPKVFIYMYEFLEITWYTPRDYFRCLDIMGMGFKALLFFSTSQSLESSRNA